MLATTVAHLLDHVVPAAHDYFAAEQALTDALSATNGDLSKCQTEANNVKRQAANVGVAIDGLADRAARALGSSPDAIRAQVATHCSIRGGTVRDGCIDRICAVANVYKHEILTRPKHPIKSESDILVVASGFGADGYGIGKSGGAPEVLVRLTNGQQRKFVGDVAFGIAGWFAFLKAKGAAMPADTVTVCNQPMN